MKKFDYGEKKSTSFRSPNFASLDNNFFKIEEMNEKNPNENHWPRKKRNT